MSTAPAPAPAPEAVSLQILFLHDMHGDKNERLEKYYRDVLKNIPITSGYVFSFHPSYFLLRRHVPVLEQYAKEKRHIELFVGKVLVCTVNRGAGSKRKKQTDLFVHYTNAPDVYFRMFGVDAVVRDFTQITFVQNEKNAFVDDASTVPLANLPNVFVIHLERAFDRMRNLLLLKDANIRYHLVSAISYETNDGVSDYCDYLMYRRYYEHAIYQMNLWNSYTRGAICLALSNLLVFNYCTSADDDANNINNTYFPSFSSNEEEGAVAVVKGNILILEDDIYPHVRFHELLAGSLATVPSDWTVLRLGTKQMSNMPCVPSSTSPDWVHVNKGTFATHAMLYRDTNVLRTMHDLFRQFTKPIDCYHDEMQQQLGGGLYASAVHPFITQCETTSVALHSETYEQWGWDVSQYVTRPRKPIHVVNRKFVFGNGWDVVVRLLTNTFAVADVEESGGTAQQPKKGKQLKKNDVVAAAVVVEKEDAAAAGSENEVLFYDFVDDSLGWNGWKTLRYHHHKNPTTHSWCGIIHHPYQLPAFWGTNVSVADYLCTPIWQDGGAKNCKMLFVLSAYLKQCVEQDALLQKYNIPVVVLQHPICNISPPRIPDFSFDAFLKNPNKRLIAVGWSFRKLSSIYLIRTPAQLQRAWLFNGSERAMELLKSECAHYGVTIDPSQVEILGKQTTAEYHQLLSENVVFADFEDASANNIIMECIAQKTPIVVKRIPPVVEYLGPEYPLYYDRLEDVETLVTDKAIFNAHMYLSLKDMTPFSMASFMSVLYDAL